MTTHLHPRVLPRAFTLVELLVVVAIIGVMFSLLLPAINKARDTAMEVKCRANMKQIGVAAESFRTDFRALLTNGWYPRYPSGFDGNFPPADRGNPVTYAHTLMQFNYVPNVRKPYGFLTTAGFEVLAAAARKSVFGCPTMFTGHSATYYDTRFPGGGWANLITNDTQRRSAAFWIDLGYDAAFPTQAITGQIFSGYYATNLENVHPTIVRGVPNIGYFPVRDWRSSPATVAYLFEDFFWTSGPVFSYTDAITFGNARYQPPIRHNNYTSTNLLYADGHIIKFPTPAYTSLADISNQNNAVWMNFY